MASSIIALPPELRFDVGYDIGTIPGPEVFNRNVAVSSTGSYSFVNTEVPSAPLLPSPTLAGEATQLPGGALVVFIAGGSVVPGEHTQLDVNDPQFIDAVTIDMVFEGAFGPILSSDPAVQEFTLFTILDETASIDFGPQSGNSFSLIPELELIRLEIDGANLTGSSAFIDAAMKVVLVPVPIPAGFFLFVSALGVLSWARVSQAR